MVMQFIAKIFEKNPIYGENRLFFFFFLKNLNNQNYLLLAVFPLLIHGDLKNGKFQKLNCLSINVHFKSVYKHKKLLDVGMHLHKRN